MDSNKYKLTVFTPTYNRSYSLTKLYESLVRQTVKDFEWLIVDDGSTDKTQELIKGWIANKEIPIRYILQPNGGKHRAINRGVIAAFGELFFIVDSDDYLTDDAVETVCEQWNLVQHNPKICGVVGLRIYPNGKKIGGGTFKDMSCSFLEFRHKYKIKGDMAEVVKTEIFRKYPFPEVPNEKFCPEALVWNRMAAHYDAKYFFKGVYVCKYLTDGLTAKITQIRHRSPVASCMYYSELAKMPISLLQKIKASTNFWRFYTRSCSENRISISTLLCFIGFLPGKLMRIKDILQKKN